MTENDKLAILGGPKVRSKPWPNWPDLREEDLKPAIEAISTGNVGADAFNYTTTFEEKFAEYCGVKYGITANSGTSACHMAVAATQVGPGDEVIVPCHTFYASAAAICQNGARPVFADIDPKTLCIDPEDIRKKITPRTKAIMPVHIWGQPCEMDPIMELAEKHSLYVIEDCAQAHGVEYKGKKVGGIGHISAFSMISGKIMCTGYEGGMVVTDDPEMAVLARRIGDLGYAYEIMNERLEGRPLMKSENGMSLYLTGSHVRLHDRIGWNYRLTEFQSAIGLKQFERLETDNLNVRRRNGLMLNEHLKDVKEINIPVEPDHVKHGYWWYPITLNIEYLNCNRLEFIFALQDEGIVCGAGETATLYDEPVFQKLTGFGRSGFPFECEWCPPDSPLHKGKWSYENVVCKNGEALDKRLLIISIQPTCGEEEMNDIVTAVKKVCKAYSKL